MHLSDKPYPHLDRWTPVWAPALPSRGTRSAAPQHRRWPAPKIGRTVTMQLRTEGTLRCHAVVTLVLGRPPGVGAGVPAMRLIKEESMPLVLDTADFLKKCAGLSMMRHQA